MTLTAFDIYLVSVCGNINTIAILIIFLSISVLLILLVLYILGDKDEQVAAIQQGKFTSIILAITLAIATLIPSSKTLAAMYVLPAVVNSDFIQKLPSDISALAQAYVKDLLNGFEDKNRN